MRRGLLIAPFLAAAALGLAGCAGYQAGARNRWNHDCAREVEKSLHSPHRRCQMTAFVRTQVTG